MGRSDGSWVELADRVWARRYAELDLTVGLVVGSERALVVDTRGDRAQGAELAAAVRAVTALPVRVVLTHAHFDHCFGTCAFLDPAFSDPAAPGAPGVLGVPVYAHPGCAAAIRDTAEEQRAEWTHEYRERGDLGTAADLAATEIVPPNMLVEHATTLDLGGRTAVLSHAGRGHTGHDLVVHLPGTGVLFAGDLVEQGAPPDFTDAHPLDWPATVQTLLTLRPDVVVPGHGDPVGPEFVVAQQAELATVAELCRAVLAGECTETAAVHAGPHPAESTRTALRRARVSALG